MGAGRLITDGVSGFVVPAGDVDALAAAMAKLASSPDLRLSFGQAAEAAALNFTYEEIGSYRARAFQALLQRDPCRRALRWLGSKPVLHHESRTKLKFLFSRSFRREGASRNFAACVCARQPAAEAATAIEVAHGCDVRNTSNGGRNFYVDPVRGAKDNDGSEAKPWRTLAEVLDPNNHLVATRTYGRRTLDGALPTVPINPNGPIRPGDTIVLMSGDHGTVDVSKYVNQNFISVVAGPGQTPLVRSLRLVSSSHWLFRRIKFQGQRPEKDLYGPMVGVGMNDYFGPADNIVFTDDFFSTADQTEG